MPWLFRGSAGFKYLPSPLIILCDIGSGVRSVRGRVWDMHLEHTGAASSRKRVKLSFEFRV